MHFCSLEGKLAGVPACNLVIALADGTLACRCDWECVKDGILSVMSALMHYRAMYSLPSRDAHLQLH